ncbi:glycosyltransferase family 4 protein, partial [Salinivibrio sp. IB868]
NMIVAISKKLEELALDFGAKNVWLRPNPVDEARFFVDYENRLKFRHQLTKFHESDIILCHVANYIDRKNQLFSVELLAALPDKFKLVLAGPLKNEETNYFNRVNDRIKELDLEARVEVKTGFVENFDEYIKASDVFLFPSKSEGLGTPLLEAQACGIPVVSNKIEGISDTVIHWGQGGFYLPLIVDKWKDAVLDSLEISKWNLIANSKIILGESSTKKIDKLYVEKVQSLLNSNHKSNTYD